MPARRAPPASRRGLDPWLTVPLLAALASSGVAPMLLPLEIVEIEGRALHVGLVMAAVGAGLLTSPLWSRLAARRAAHRWVMAAGCLVIAVAVGGFCLAREVHEWAALAAGMGVGAAAVFTTASQLIADRYAAAERSARLGWLQTLTTVGTMVGLALAGGISHLRLEPAYGFALASLLASIAALLGIVLVPGATAESHAEAVARAAGAGDETPPGGAMPAGLSRSAAASPFYLLLVLWGFAGLGVYAVGAFYPLLMRHEFHVQPAVSSYCLAVVTGVSALLFVPASSLASRLGELRVLQGGLGVRLVSLALLATMAMTPLLERAWLAFIPYTAFLLAWPLLSISSVLLVSRLGSAGGSSGIGAFSAVGALASLAGPVVGGHAADTFGYTSIWLLAAAGVGLALLLTVALTRPDAAVGRAAATGAGAAGSGEVA